MKKLNKKESASMSELLGILSYSERDTCFQLEGWGCLDIVRVICSDFQAIRDIDLEYENLKLQQFYSRYPADLKLVCVSMPERCTEQIQYVTHKLESCLPENDRKVWVRSVSDFCNPASRWDSFLSGLRSDWKQFWSDTYNL